MKASIGWLGAGLFLAGCAHHQPAPASRPPPPAASQQPQAVQPVIKPDLLPRGQVAMVNPTARFVVITYPSGVVPPTGSQLFLYRNGVKVGLIRVTGPQRDNDTVADILSGDAKLQDEVRFE